MRVTSLVNDAPGLREVVQYGKTGLIAAADSDQFIQTLQKVVDNPAQFRPVADAARQVVMTRHRLDRNAQQLVELYKAA